ncbi:hypothetical protein OIU77_004764, partial [Salix suchowensis]|jgi:hypothetical protein
MDY